MTVHTHAFRIGDEVRREIAAAADAGRSIDGIRHLRHRALAVRSGNMNGCIGTLRIAKACTEFLHPRKTQTNAEAVQFIQIEK